MIIRKCLPGEEKELWRLFHNTVHTVNRRDYTADQVHAWSPDCSDEDRWRLRIEKNSPFVCVHDEQLIGFADLQSDGHIDLFYVHSQWQRRGVGRLLFDALESSARTRNLRVMTSDVSVTARPFFESRGFVVIKEQEVVLGSVVLKNFRMQKVVEREGIPRARSATVQQTAIKAPNS